MKHSDFDKDKIAERFDLMLLSMKEVVLKRFSKIPDARIRRVLSNWEHGLKHLLRLGGVSGGNKTEFYFDGDLFFEELKKVITFAKKSVWIEMYMIKNDRIGKLIKDLLHKAAIRGCEVIVIYDHVGSNTLGRSFFKTVSAAGGNIQVFNPIWPWRKKGPFTHRDHRKIVIIDEHIAFCGGMNFTEEYAGKKLGIGQFVDAQVKVQGPAVRDFSELFIETLGETSGEFKLMKKRKKPVSEGEYVQVLASNTRRNLRAIQKSMKETLERATEHCYISTPYFLPYGPLRKAIIGAAKRGVDVRIITAGLSDIPIARRAGQYVYESILKSGVRIYEMFGTMLHAKTATIDGIYASVGSFNLDHWSEGRNLEVTTSIFSSDAAKALEEEFEKNLKSSKEIELSSWQNRGFFLRMLQWVCYKLCL